MVAAVAPLDAPTAEVPVAPPVIQRRLPQWQWMALGIGAAALIAIIATLFWRVRAIAPAAQTRVTVTAAPVHSVAVLPFENLSADATGAVLALGISESVLHQLATA